MSGAENLDLCFKKALELARQAGMIIRDASGKNKCVETKSSYADLVTETDRQVEQFLFDGFRATFPHHRFIGEETSSDGGACQEFTIEPTWIIDPIDGTTNFVHGFPLVAVSIALAIEHKIVVGVVYNPFLDLMYTARKGQGAYCNGKKLQVSAEEDLSKALVFGEIGSLRTPEAMDAVFSNLQSVIPKVHGNRSLGSAALDMATIATGGGNVYFEYGIHCWDMAAASLIVTEAGGVVMDPTGEPFDLMSRRVLCAGSPKLAQEVILLLKHLELDRD